MPRPAVPLLEVIVLNAADARAAAAGGADRLEVVSDIADDGLTPTPKVVAEVRAACDVPLRAMLRPHAGFAAPKLDTLLESAAELTAAGADGFVFGFLDPDRQLDSETMYAVAAGVSGPWTCHRVVDHARDHAAAVAAAVAAPGCDQVLSAGDPAGVEAGMEMLLQSAGQPKLLVGGGLRLSHVPRLQAAGVTAFHIGRGARSHWAAPVEAERVAIWRGALDAAL